MTLKRPVEIGVNEQDFNFVMFDLHPVIRRYVQLIGTQSLYIFFHEISNEAERYPLFSVEVEARDGEHNIVVKSARNVIMINTPAVNKFEFDTILTTPRACLFEEGFNALAVVERFLQAKYDVSERFILAGNFRPLIQDNLPTVRYRIGFQAVREEDRRILDYSELITTLDTGGGKKFIDLITSYVDGNVTSTANEVQKTYERKFPRKSAERLVPKSLTVPLSLNETQKRILTAVENLKNKIIVVDGPPGTGKSYTIMAIIYLANQLGKSVMVTSHKKQALDVIDQALTEQFKTLHPRSKPSILRLEKLRGPASLNNIENTLSSPVINAARGRINDLNEEAVSEDRDRLHNEISDLTSAFWEDSDKYKEVIQMTFEWAREHEAVFGTTQDQSETVPPRLPSGVSIEITRIRAIIESLGTAPVGVSLNSLNALCQEKDGLPEILSKCDSLNQLNTSVSTEIMDKLESVPPEIAEFQVLIEKLLSYLEPDILTSQFKLEGVELLPPDNLSDAIISTYVEAQHVRSVLSRLAELENKFLGKLFKNKEAVELRRSLETDHHRLIDRLNKDGARSVLAGIEEAIKYADEIHDKYPFLTRDYALQGYRQCPPSELGELVEKLKSLEFNSIVTLIETLQDANISDISLNQIRDKLAFLEETGEYIELHAVIQTFADHVGMSTADLPALYATLKQVKKLVDGLDNDDLANLSTLFKYYGPLLKEINVDQSDISSLSRLAANTDRFEHFLRYLQLHAELSSLVDPIPPAKSQLDEYFTKTRKLLEYKTDLRLSNLVNHAADVQRIQTAIAAGKRISSEQAQVLLNNLSCVISEPGLISRHFPMEADMIDLLIIDEASQVSIAESISLMLRARQTIVFGDELQYGAVGAVNVSRRYSEYYFKDILRDYSIDRNEAISDEEKDRIAREVSDTPSEDDEESSSFLPVAPGTKEWLKTFSVRTSTLSFAKALQNYSESLNIHFRSFPEIISYSNEYFYKESQIELIANRIRTKPIKEVLRFIKVDTKGLSGHNVNLDEIEAIQLDIENIIAGGYKGTISVICSFREQALRMEEFFRKEMKIYPDLVRHHKFRIWFVGDVQGEERDLVYYSFVQDKKIDNADLRTIYPIIGGSADNIRRLKMQRLNVGFSRAKDIIVFVHSMPIGDYSDTRLGDALRHYEKELGSTHDQYVEDESVFASPAEKELYRLILQTPFFQKNRDNLRLIAQFEIGKYIRAEYHRNIPGYRVDFLLTKTVAGKEKSLIIEYDGVEFHTRNPDIVTKHNFDQEYLEYDVERQLELESYGYSFLRINKFSLVPRRKDESKVDVLNAMLEDSFK